jgi:putative oxidoreductase
MANKKNRIDAKQPNKLILLVFRIILGIILFAKGISFLRDKALLENLISNSITEEKFSIVGLLIPYIHIAGGFFIIIGLYIRVSILIQLPIIIGAIILLLESGGKPYQGEILFATLILIMLLVQLVYGDGLYSWRNLLNKEKNIT